jgi:hypothetical protein
VSPDRFLRTSWDGTVTFHPLRLTTFAKGLDDGKYAYSWYENAPDGVPTDATVDGDATGAGLMSHL